MNGVLDFLPHVGNLTRNVIVRSESATGTRGHMIATHMADVDIRYALFKDLGRTTYQPLNTTTNHIGRYPIHMHHLSGPMATPANGYQFTLLGNAVDGGSAETKFKWGITVHGSHYGSIKDNVVYNYNGASIATEDGSESFNVFDHNFALRGIGEPNNSVSEARMAMGTEGVGFWFRGPNNFVKNNVAANFQNPTDEAAYGFAYPVPLPGQHRGAEFQGRDGRRRLHDQERQQHADPASSRTTKRTARCRAASRMWWVSSPGSAALRGRAGERHQGSEALERLQQGRLHVSGAEGHLRRPEHPRQLQLGRPRAAATACTSRTTRRRGSSSAIQRHSGHGGRHHGPRGGLCGRQPNLTAIENSYLRNHLQPARPDQRVGQRLLDGQQAGRRQQLAVRGAAGPESHRNHAWSRDVARCARVPEQAGSEMRVYAYNGVATDNFQVYTTVEPRSCRGRSCGSPATRAGINGLTCTIAAQGPVPPTATFSVSPTSIASGQSATLTWSATNATTVSINQGIGTVAAVGHQERVADRDDDLHADRDERRRVGDRDRHRHGRRHADDADDHLEYSRQHRLRDGIERDAAERDHDGAGIVGVFAGRRNGSRGGGGTDAVGHVHADRHRQLQLGDRDGRDHRAEGDAAHHLGERRPTSARARRSAPRS